MCKPSFQARWFDFIEALVENHFRTVFANNSVPLRLFSVVHYSVSAPHLCDGLPVIGAVCGIRLIAVGEVERRVVLTPDGVGNGATCKVAGSALTVDACIVFSYMIAVVCRAVSSYKAGTIIEHVFVIFNQISIPVVAAIDNLKL